MPTSAAVQYTNQNSGIIGFNEAGNYGYFTGSDGAKHKIKGITAVDGKVEFSVVSASGEVLGTGVYRARKNPSTPIIADGLLTIDGEEIPIVVVAATIQEARGHSFFPDSFGSKPVDAPF